MNNEKPKYRRRSLRLPDYDYTQPRAYFVTICTWKRHSLFGEVVDDTMILNRSGQVARDQWIRLSIRFPQADFSKYIIMPNHVHGIIWITSEMMGTGDKLTDISKKSLTHRTNHKNQIALRSLGTLVRAYKSSVTWRLHTLDQSTRMPIWQRNYYEHIIRDEQDLQNISDYIQTNPCKWEQDQLFL